MALKPIQLAQKGEMHMVTYYDKDDDQRFLTYAINDDNGDWREAWGNMKPLKHEPTYFWSPKIEGGV